MFPDAESSSLFVPGDDGLDERDASVRALRPRSSRRGSWGSEVSGWSAQILQVSGTPSLSRERSLFTSNSVRLGDISTENGRNSQESVETESRTDEGALTDVAPRSPTSGGIDDSQYDASSMSHDLTEVTDTALDASHTCHRSASLDTVGRGMNEGDDDNELSTAISNVTIADEEKPN